MRFDNAIVDGHGHVSFPDRQITVEELKKEFLGHSLRVIVGSEYTIAVESAGKAIVGWMNVNTLGFDNVDIMISVQLKLDSIISGTKHE